MNEKWLDLRAGPLKTLFGDLHHLRRYLQGLRSEDEKLGAYIKDLREATHLQPPATRIHLQSMVDGRLTVLYQLATAVT